jgi:hypothetical protein
MKPCEPAVILKAVEQVRALGWLCVAEKIGANGFDARDERLLSSVGSLASRLYEAGGPQI